MAMMLENNWDHSVSQMATIFLEHNFYGNHTQKYGKFSRRNGIDDRGKFIWWET